MKSCSDTARKIAKRVLNDDTFTLRAEAMARSYDLGLEGAIHVHQTADGQATYMPGDSHEAYMAQMGERAGLSAADDSKDEGEYKAPESDDLLERVIYAILQAVTKANDETVISQTAKASGAEPLYAFRPVLNAEMIREWAASQGFERALPADDMHVTVVFSKTPFSAELTEAANAQAIVRHDNIVVTGGKRTVTPLGDKGAVVLKIECAQLQYEHMAFRAMGASWDFQEYTPHITITYTGSDAPVARMQPFLGDIVLGPLHAKPLNPEWDAEVTETALTDSGNSATLRETTKSEIMDDTFVKTADVIKVDSERRIAWGWASVSTLKGELVVDRQGDVIAPTEMEKMADGFMASARTAKAMHEGAGVGEVLHSLPLTKELADALGVQTDREGWIIGMRIHDAKTWQMFKNGTLAAFSIGGKAKRKEIEQ